MINAFARIGRTCASLAIAGGLTAVAMFASGLNTVNINLPHTVEVGSVTLPQGSYSLNSVVLGSGDVLFVVRATSGETVTLQARRIAADDANDKTHIEFSTADNAWHFDKLFIEGAGTGYEFVNSK